jgi:hypothetical protein
VYDLSAVVLRADEDLEGEGRAEDGWLERAGDRSIRGRSSIFGLGRRVRGRKVELSVVLLEEDAFDGCIGHGDCCRAGAKPPPDQHQGRKKGRLRR